MDTYIFKVAVFIKNRLNMNRSPYSPPPPPRIQYVGSVPLARRGKPPRRFPGRASRLARRSRRASRRESGHAAPVGGKDREALSTTSSPSMPILGESEGERSCSARGGQGSRGSEYDFFSLDASSGRVGGRAVVQRLWGAGIERLLIDIYTYVYIYM